MRLVEIITVRLCDPLPKALISEIGRALTDCNKDDRISKIGILVDVKTGRDLSVHIPTDITKKTRPA